MTREIDEEILRRLTEAKQEYGQLLKPVELFDKLLRLQVDVSSRIAGSPRGLTLEVIEGRVGGNRAVLEFEDLSLDWALIEEVFQAVLKTVSEYVLRESEGAGGIDSITPGTFPLKAVVEDWYKGSSLSSYALDQNISEELLASVIQATMNPFLKVYSDKWVGQINQKRWRRRYCPICGGKPDFAFLEKEAGARWLMCSRCEAQWLFQRLECPYCGNNEQKTLAYFTDDTELYRLYVCDKCHNYIKAIDLRKTESDVLLPLERIVTFDLDKQAREKGYNRGVPSGVPL